MNNQLTVNLSENDAAIRIQRWWRLKLLENEVNSISTQTEDVLEVTVYGAVFSFFKYFINLFRYFTGFKW